MKGRYSRVGCAILIALLLSIINYSCQNESKDVEIQKACFNTDLREVSVEVIDKLFSLSHVRQFKFISSDIVEMDGGPPIFMRKDSSLFLQERDIYSDLIYGESYFKSYPLEKLELDLILALDIKEFYLGPTSVLFKLKNYGDSCYIMHDSKNSFIENKMFWVQNRQYYSYEDSSFSAKGSWLFMASEKINDNTGLLIKMDSLNQNVQHSFDNPIIPLEIN